MNPVTNQDIMEELHVLKSEKKFEKQRHQVKSRWYYIFWGTATVTVFVGQVFVGNGFRRMAQSFESILDSPIQLDFGVPRYRHRMIVPEWEGDGLYHPTNPPMELSPQYKEDVERRLY